jgi:hypothetical protein
LNPGPVTYFSFRREGYYSRSDNHTTRPLSHYASESKHCNFKFPYFNTYDYNKISQTGNAQLTNLTSNWLLELNEVPPPTFQVFWFFYLPQFATEITMHNNNTYNLFLRLSSHAIQPQQIAGISFSRIKCFNSPDINQRVCPDISAVCKYFLRAHWCRIK